jgi:acylphosphatase
MQKRLECNIVGRVQMVMFRDFAQRTASRLGLVGEVWNEADGSVSVVAEGEESALSDLLGYLHHGPILAHVESVHADWSAPAGTFPDFRIRYR